MDGLVNYVCFIGDFALLVVRVGMVDHTSVFVWITTLDPSHSLPVADLMFSEIRPSVVYSDVPETLANHLLPSGSISSRVYYIVLLIGCIRPACNRGVAVFPHLGPYYFPCSRKDTFLLCFTSSNSFSFL